MDAAEEAIAVIRGIQSVEDVDQLQSLQDALDRLFTTPHPERGLDVLFNLFERFPDSAG